MNQPVKNYSVRHRVLKSLWEAYHSWPTWYQFDRWLDGQFKKNPAFGKRDRKWYSQHLFAAFRYAELAFVFLGEKPSKLTTSDEMKKKFLTHNTDDFWQIIEERAAMSDPTLTEFVFSETQDWHQQLTKLEASTTLEDQLLFSGVPRTWKEWILERAHKSSWTEEELKSFVSSLGKKAPLWIRLNYLDRAEELKKELAHENINILEEEGGAFLLEGNKSLYALASFHAGAFEVQDWASQQILQIDSLKGIKKVWDSCAGAGGKTLQIAALMQNRGVIYSSDLRERALEELRRRAKRANFQTVRTFIWDGQEIDWKKLPEVRDGAFDYVLVDAPCSSSGVLRRNPELRYRIQYQDVNELNQLQARLLENASRGVKPGGFLCYGTCSFFVSENEAMVESFSKAHLDFELKSQKMHGMPQRNSDATFSALWQRKS